MSNCSTQLSTNLPIGKHQAAHLSDTLANNNGSDNQCKNGDHLLSFSEKLACTLYSLTQQQQQQSNPPLINQPTQQLNPNNSPAATSCSLFHHNNLSPTANNMHPNHNRKLSTKFFVPPCHYYYHYWTAVTRYLARSKLQKKMRVFFLC